MSARLSLPLSQQRHSNVAVVRLTKGNKRIEIACYKNKVVAFRNGAETNLAEVIQIDRVFSNVSRGEFASMTEIRHVIGEDITEQDAIKFILQHGVLQVASQERNVSQAEMTKDVCTIVAQKLVNPVTKRPYAPVLIEEAVRSIGFSIRQDQSAKKQAMIVAKELCARQIIPVMRAQMRLRLSGLGVESVLESSQCVLIQKTGEAIEIDIDPELFRPISEDCAKNKWVVTVVEYNVSDTTQGDADAFVVTNSNPVSRAAVPSEKPEELSRTQAKKAKRAQKQAKKSVDQDSNSD